MLHRSVIGLKVAQWPALNFPDHLRDGDRGRVDEIDMPYDLAQRLYTFADKHYMKGVPDFFCYSFMCYVMGWGSSTDLRVREYVGYRVHPERIEPHGPYVMYRGGESGEPVHGLIGIGHQTNLSVIGNNQPLVLSRTTDLMKAYSADTLLRVNMVLY